MIKANYYSGRKVTVIGKAVVGGSAQNAFYKRCFNVFLRIFSNGPTNE